MKKLLLLSLFLFSCSKDHSSDLVKNFHARISKTNYNIQNISQDKFHTPQLCNLALFEIVDGEYKYKFFEMNSCEYYGARILTKEFVYGHEISDTVHFDYVAKIRLFNISKK